MTDRLKKCSPTQVLHFPAPREGQLLWVGVTDSAENLDVVLDPMKCSVASWSSQPVKRTGNEPSKKGNLWWKGFSKTQGSCLSREQAEEMQFLELKYLSASQEIPHWNGQGYKSFSLARGMSSFLELKAAPSAVISFKYHIWFSLREKVLWFAQEQTLSEMASM